MLQVYIIGFLGALGIAHGCWVVFVRPNKKRITKTHNQIKIYKKNQKLKTKSKKIDIPPLTNDALDYLSNNDKRPY